jgi:hypothetical protein
LLGSNQLPLMEKALGIKLDLKKPPRNFADLSKIHFKEFCVVEAKFTKRRLDKNAMIIVTHFNRELKGY